MRRGHQGRTDASQSAIVAALRSVGASVESLASVGRGCPDLLCGFRDEDYKLECKVGKGKYRESQVKWNAEWRGKPAIKVTTPEEALRAIGAIR